MTKIPVRDERREAALLAVERLLSGQRAERSCLFKVHPADQIERLWQKPFLKRMIDEGAIGSSGTSRDRKYFCKDPGRLSVFRHLLKETDKTTIKWGYGNSFRMNEKLKAILDGIILGDGYYQANHLSAALVLGQRYDRREWLEQLRSMLSAEGVESSLSEIKEITRQLPNGKILRGQRGVVLRTRFYRTLLEERKRWYPGEKKTLPHDLDIGNPVTLAQWFMGDGHCNASSKVVGISTHCFSEAEVQSLRRDISEKLYIKSYLCHWRGYPVLQINNENAAKFIELVRPYTVSCFSYKIPKELWTPPRCVECGIEIPGMTRGARYCFSCCDSSLRCYRKKRNLVLSKQ